MRINNISFDLWGTLIKGNPNTKKSRAQYFYDNYNPKNRSLEEVLSLVRVIDDEGNKQSERSGWTVQPEQYVYWILDSLGNDVDFKMVNSVTTKMQDLFLENPPTLYDEDTLSTLKEVTRGRYNILISNTGFIKGTAIWKMVHQLNLSQFFNIRRFSDSMRVSKPDPRIYSDYKGKATLHVGDSITADKVFAENKDNHYVIINRTDLPEGIVSIPSIKYLPEFIRTIK